ncbi:MAG: hypothetical protein FJX23_07035 [Alphaproteobacteria bacterium]|nr:hypothetical protein [Alphaproteobacteria bacterium]
MNEKLFFARALAVRTSKYFLLLAALALFVTLWVVVGIFAVIALVAFALAIFIVTNATAGAYVTTKFTAFLAWASSVLNKVAQKIHEKAIEIRDDAKANANASFLTSIAKKENAKIAKAQLNEQDAEKNVTDLMLALEIAHEILADRRDDTASAKETAAAASLAAAAAQEIANARNAK